VKALVLGARGFVGRHLVDELARRGAAVEAWSRRPIGAGSAGVEPPLAGVEAVRADLLEPASFRARRGPWDLIVHLAAHAVPNAAFSAAMARENVLLVRHALEHAAAVAPGARFVLVSSAAVYAAGPGRRRESDALAPRGAYGASKAECEAVAHGFDGVLDLRIARFFNQLGPGLPAGLFTSDLLARLARGERPLCMQGGDATRDFLDVRDGVEALLAIAAAPRAGTWNVASGEACRLSELAAGLCALLAPGTAVEFAPGPADELVGDPSRLVTELGWRARRSRAETLAYTAGRTDAAGRLQAPADRVRP